MARTCPARTRRNTQGHYVFHECVVTWVFLRMYASRLRRTLGCRDEYRRASTGKDVVTMIDWESDSWGGTVHLAANGSWVNTKHGHDSDQQD